MLAGISFPHPVPYDGDEGQEGPPGRAYEGTQGFSENKQQEEPRTGRYQPIGYVRGQRWIQAIHGWPGPSMDGLASTTKMKTF